MAAVLSLPDHRFLCDAMLGRLARYLRAAGYDTRLAGSEPDRQLVAEAADQTRWLLTLDRQIVEHRRARNRVILLVHGTLDQQVALLSTQLPIDWLSRAFTRCIVDNTVLVSHPETSERRTGEAAAHCQHCPTCGRTYWHGSHVNRMEARLVAWQTLGPRDAY